MDNMEDVIYSVHLDKIIDFRFDKKVVDVFPDMIQRSVPGYETLISTIGIMAARYAQDDSYCYDLGCSLGAVSLSMRHSIKQKDCNIIAIDNSIAMIEKSQLLLAEDKYSEVDVRLACANIHDILIKNASVVVLNLTLQFIPVEERLELLKRIYQGLNPGGVLILSEKLTFEDTDENNFHMDMHHTFKRSNGYSDLEISQKYLALENVLRPETLSEHQARLYQAGFEFIKKWFQYFNFASIVAMK
ncbi:MAG: carboxy-S-adenosyl-L-methionine synthase CmoA [Piscirickettsiaceae bacterium]|nr:carboxy-S-adenosyl-L-methionine synthase CmoA [Piscirickettsiaceae bacterium]